MPKTEGTRKPQSYKPSFLTLLGFPAKNCCNSDNYCGCRDGDDESFKFWGRMGGRW
ncbi:conserved hypothetical protein [Ricinus communis]|uniref:Uncharacterized protein n=1 Tax=Ricinus communis TaxID=3988 RepID=B9T1H3_RICCO|nr:conserved hypothetical protein [Ricinus communis]